MIRKSQLTKFSLAEIFQSLAQTYQTGLLTISTQTNEAQQSPKYYIWLLRGCIVAVNNRLDGQGLISKIEQRNWLKPEIIKHLVEQCPANTPLGIFLRTENVLTAQQLKLLFYAQVLQPVCGLFKLKNAQFEFNALATLPQTEMTGLSLSAARAALLGLRALRDWDGLSAKLPNPNSVVKRVISGKPNFKLDALESKVWELANGELCLAAIAEELSLTIQRVQQIAFRLVRAGLVEAVSPNDVSFLKAGRQQVLVTAMR